MLTSKSQLLLATKRTCRLDANLIETSDSDATGLLDMAITLDLNTMVIPDSKKIWIVHTGRNHNHYNTFKDENCIFLELPDLKLTEDILADDSALRQRIRYSHMIRAMKGPVRQDGSEIKLNDFNGKPGSDVSVQLRTVKHLALRIQDGDLIIVPGKGLRSQVLLGEADGSFFPQKTIRPAGMLYAEVPVRKVRWTSTDRSKLDLPAELIAFFEKPPAIAEVPRSFTTEKFFDFAYESYLKSAYSSGSILAPKYDGHDFKSFVVPAELIILAVSIYCAYASGEKISGLQTHEIILKYYKNDALADARTKFASPGRYNFTDKDRRLAMFIMAFTALAMSGELTACKNDPNSVTTINSKANDDPTTSKIDEIIKLSCKDAGEDVLEKAQNQAKDSHQKLNLKTPAKVN